jgi:hypothetical protein
MLTSPTPHLLNLALHVGAGIAAMGLGLFMLGAAKGTARHRQRGRVFVGLTGVVCATAIIGNLWFRFIPVFAVLTLLVSYQLASGWHVIATRAAGPNWRDLLLLCGGVGGALALVPVLLGASVPGTTGSVVYASLGALAVLLVYDAARWGFPRRWHASLWRYEHIYKIISALFAMLSAASGNLIKVGQPWSQLLPSVAGALAIAWFCWQTWRRQRRVPSG